MSLFIIGGQLDKTDFSDFLESPETPEFTEAIDPLNEDEPSTALKLFTLPPSKLF